VLFFFFLRDLDVMRLQGTEDAIADTTHEWDIVEALRGLLEEHVLQVSYLIGIQVIVHGHGILIDEILLMLVLLARGLELGSVPVVSTSLTDTSNNRDHQAKEDRAHKQHIHSDKKGRNHPILLAIASIFRPYRVTTRGI
jgi:hypothetical protein